MDWAESERPTLELESVMDEARRTELRQSFLAYLSVYRRTRNPDSSLFGTLIDSWYAYYRGGIFVKRTGNPRTLANPTGRLELEAMRQLPFISQSAGEVLFQGAKGRLVREHSIPKAFLRELFLDELPLESGIDEIQEWLCRRYHVAVLTYAEHRNLPNRSAMPKDWDGNDVWCRYLGIARYRGSMDKSDDEPKGKR